MTQEELKKIEDRCKAATPAPELIRYEHGGGRSFITRPTGNPISPDYRDLIADYYDESNREFYYNARTDIPKLLAYIRELEAEYERIKPMVGRVISEQIFHTRSCRVYEDMCTCGFIYRVYLQTEQEISAAWRKRAEEAEGRIRELEADKEALAEEVRKYGTFSQRRGLSRP